jgi:hypothetical protein
MENKFIRKELKTPRKDETVVLERQKNIAVLVNNLNEFIEQKNKDLQQDKIELIEDFFTNLRKLTEILNNQRIREKILNQEPLDFDFLTFHFDVRDDKNSINKIIDFLDKFEFLFKKFGFAFKKVLFVSINQEIKEIKEVSGNEWVSNGAYKRGYQILINKEELSSKIQDEAKKLNILKILTKLQSAKLSKEGKIVDDPLFYFNDYFKFLLKEYESFKNKKEFRERNVAINNKDIQPENNELKGDKGKLTNFDSEYLRNENFNRDIFIKNFLKSEEKERDVLVGEILPSKLLNFYKFILENYLFNKFSIDEVAENLERLKIFGIKNKEQLKKFLTKLETYFCIKKINSDSKNLLYQAIPENQKRQIVKLDLNKNFLKKDKIFIFLESEDGVKNDILEAENKLSELELWVWNIIKNNSQYEFISIAGYMFPKELFSRISYQKLNSFFESLYEKKLLDKGYILGGSINVPIYRIKKYNKNINI